MRCHVDPAAKIKQLESHLTQKVIPAFQADCFSHESLAYSELDRRLAYGLHFAPKHALIWRRYLNEMPNSSLRKCTRFNSIGTGPGSEIIGILEASDVPNASEIEIVCLEREQEWREIFESVMSTYLLRSNLKVSWTYTDDPQHLLVGAPVVGSCVLSELGRERRITSFRKAIFKRVGGVRARFLDFPSFPRDDGTKYIEDIIPGCKVIKLYEKDWNLMGELNAEMNACQPCHCRVPQIKEPGMRMHLFRFS